MARSSNLITSTQAVERQLVRWIDWLIVDSRAHRRGFPLGRHVDVDPGLKAAMSWGGGVSRSNQFRGATIWVKGPCGPRRVRIEWPGTQ